jgi:hypothetical protein
LSAPTPAHAEAAARMRALMLADGLPEPDHIAFRRGEVWFVWDGPKVALAIELEPAGG